MAKKHSLSVENIDQVAIDFIATKPSYSIKITDCQEGKLKKIAITHLSSSYKCNFLVQD